MDIKSIIYDEVDKDYYIIANKFEEKLGFFVVKIDPNKPD